jgi:hypothetical protein
MNTSNLTIKVNKKSAFQAAFGMLLICAIFIFVIFMDLIVPMEGISIAVLWFFRAFSLCILPMSISAFIFFVKKLFSDRKMSERERRFTPIFTDDAGIVWIPGFPPRDGVESRSASGDLITVTCNLIDL